MKTVTIYTDGGTRCASPLEDAVFARPVRGNRENMAAGAGEYAA